MSSINLNNAHIKNVFNKKPIIMGILNITPDSFYEDSRYYTVDKLKFNLNNILKLANSHLNLISINI